MLLESERCQRVTQVGAHPRPMDVHMKSRKTILVLIFSSEGALYVIMPYDYPAAPTF